MKYRIVMTDPPGPESQFVELEDEQGRSISAGVWAKECEMWVMTIDVAPALAAAVQAEREACMAVVRDRADRHKAAAMAIPNIADPIRYDHECRQYELQAVADEITEGTSSTIPTAGKWTVDCSDVYRFFVDNRCLASAYDGQWYTFSPDGFPGQSGHDHTPDSTKRAAVDALVRQGWYSRPSPAVDVLGVVREWRDAAQAVAECRCDAALPDHFNQLRAAERALVALVAPRTDKGES